MFHDARRFRFTRALERHWAAIEREYACVRDALIPWVERKLHDGGWRVFGIFDFPHGRPLADGVGRCPQTAALVEAHVPSHGAVGFSVMRPGTHIRPHEGYAGRFLRCHLGLSVPPGDCALRVAGATRNWETGRALVFDDRVEHEAWNHTQADRVVLLIDFIPPEGSQDSD